MTRILDISHLAVPVDVAALAAPFMPTVEQYCQSAEYTFHVEVSLCLWCLQGVELSARPRQEAFSYRLKHVVEKTVGFYISTEAFDTAAKIAGIPRRLGTPKNFFYAISGNGLSYMARRGLTVARSYLKPTEEVSR